jgi:hypothetical protein
VAGAERGLEEELGIPRGNVILSRVLPAYLQEFEFPEHNKIDREFVEVSSQCWNELPNPAGS